MAYREKTMQSFESLTPGLKKVGEALIANPILFATKPARQIAEVLGVGETMIVRFSKAVGFGGFGDLQKDVRKTLMAGPSLVGMDDEGRTNSFAGVIKSDIQNLQRTSEELDAESAQMFVETIAEAKTMQVVGYYQSFPFAHWFAFLLNTIKEDVSLFRPETDIGITKKGPAHCVLIFSYYRYALGTIRLAEEAKANGNRVLVITDSSLSPVVPHADRVLVLPGAEKSAIEKGPVTLSVMNALLLHIAERVGKLDFINPANQYFIQ
ncbi:MurR/RpiR family transcriptional regulator [Edaphobacillus lindanitolerans]|uniref:Transcriptional regulator, RpiR family n=1 Tax=Edaphobacillus lindanitolerans TaxID=550447 RepID=A0A1U7PK88_9BACI|nr:MurR/RpiR family transcriptional regulator [Edaphobacillus lindanitolerans]SIT72457.1 transcriptional regulator, RpiR family [Edaphobacillus lindanitolerans]